MHFTRYKDLNVSQEYNQKPEWTDGSISLWHHITIRGPFNWKVLTLIQARIESWLLECQPSTGISIRFQLTFGCYRKSVEVLRKKMYRHRGAFKSQPSDFCRMLYRLSYWGQPFAIPCFGKLPLAVYIFVSEVNTHKGKYIYHVAHKLEIMDTDKQLTHSS